VLCKHTNGERASLAFDLPCNMPLMYLRFNCYLYEQSCRTRYWAL